MNHKEVKLSDGRIAIVKRGKGRQAREAMKQGGQDGGKYMAAFMAQCTTIKDTEGGVIAPTMEDLDDLWADDFQAIMAAFTEVNFPQAVEDVQKEEATSPAL